MKKSFLFCLFLSLVFSKAFAQEDIIQNHSALQFYFVNGYAVSYKLPTTGLLKYRIKFDFSAGYTYSSGEGTGLNSISTESDHSRNISITLTPQAYLYILSTNYANIYTGGGVFIGYNYSKQNYNGTNHNYDGYHNYINVGKDISYSFGLSALLGLEVKLSNNVTAFAESQLNGGKTWYSWKSDFVSANDSPSWSNSSNHGWFADYSTIRIGLGIYL
jgi:hypothetical protein